MSEVDEKLSLLAEAPVFAACARRELHHIASLMRRLDVAAGEVVVREGQPGDDVFLIGSGSVEVALRGRHLATLRRGGVFGEMAALDLGPRAATVTARGPTSVYVIPRRALRRLLGELPGLRRSLLALLAERTRAVQGSPP